MILTTDLDQFLDDLEDLISDNVLELSFDKEQSLCHIPYMMNDALECYYTLSEASMQGSFDPDFSKDEQGWPLPVYDICESPDLQTRISFIDGRDSGRRSGLIIYQGKDNVSTLWFRDLKKECFSYRYHEIGHFWVNESEQWRRLTYIIGTAYDKYLFLDKELALKVCNEKELALLPAMEFAPLRYWYPVDASIFGRYPDTIEGVDFFLRLSVKYKLNKLEKLCRQYKSLLIRFLNDKEKSFGRVREFQMKRLIRSIAALLQDPASAPLYQELFEKACEASASWPSRSYAEAEEKNIRTVRQKADKKAHSLGFSGSYPRYLKYADKPMTGEVVSLDEQRPVCEELVAAEEHPFTLMDPEYPFRLRFMYSKFPPMKNPPLNYGFFKGSGHVGKILELDEL